MKDFYHSQILGYFLIIIFPLVIILGNFKFLVFNFGYYQALYSKVGVYKNFSTPKAADDATLNLFNYFKGKNNLDSSFFSSQAILHLADVKNLFRISSGLFNLSSVTCIVLILWLIIKKQQKILFNSLIVSSIATFVFTLLLGLGFLNAFDALFLKFHQIFFANNLWQFVEDDSLIKLFPQDFFIEFANRLAINILASSAIIASVAHTIKLFFERSKAKSRSSQK